MKNFIEQLTNLYSTQMADDGVILRTAIMYAGADHTFSFYIKPCGENSYTITDRGQTLEYLRENLDPNKYLDKICKICERFEIELIDGEFVGRLASLSSGQTMRNLHKFIGAMNIIANIDAL